MDSSHTFVGDFGLNMNGGDNRFMNQFSLGSGGNVMDLSGGLDFSSGVNFMTDSSMMLGGSSSASTAGLIDFPDELNSPTTLSSGSSSSSALMDISTSAPTAPITSTADAIPFPALLAPESLSTSSSMISAHEVTKFSSTTTSSAMEINSSGMIFELGNMASVWG
ncbi:hypothetical protein Plhal304r1_c064g0151681 [Plasmopara halstedii]